MVLCSYHEAERESDKEVASSNHLGIRTVANLYTMSEVHRIAFQLGLTSSGQRESPVSGRHGRMNPEVWSNERRKQNTSSKVVR